MTGSARQVVAVAGTGSCYRIGNIGMTIGAKSNLWIALKLYLQRRMGLMTNGAIATRCVVAMTIVAAEAGRHADMSAVTGNTLAIVCADIGRQLLFGLLMTTGANRPMTTHTGEISPDRLMRVVAIDTAVAGKMWISIDIVAT